MLSASSEVDVAVVLDVPDPGDKPGKLLHRDTLLDVTVLSSDRLRSPDQRDDP